MTAIPGLVLSGHGHIYTKPTHCLIPILLTGRDIMSPRAIQSWYVDFFMIHMLNITVTKKCCKCRPNFPDVLVPYKQIIHTLV